MYAVGLGAPANGSVKTGTGSTAPPIPSGAVDLNFDYRPNAQQQPSRSIIAPSFIPASPVFVGLTPGFVGLYQINFLVPPAPTALLPCVLSLGLGADPFAHVLTNLTVTVVGATSFDGARICVGPVAQ